MAASTARTRATLPKGGPRKDPARRHYDGSSKPAGLVRKDPGRHYVLVSEADTDFGPGYYESLGYVVERGTKDGVKLQGVQVKEGAAIRWRSMLLMSCAREDRDEMELHGPDGVTGQAELDRIDERLVNRDGGWDPLRGLEGNYGPHGRYVRAEKDISSLLPSQE